VDESKLPDFAQLKSCRYLQWVISETLRLFPTVPINVRSAARDCTLPVGGGEDGSKPIPVRKGQTIGMIIFAMHRLKDVWGEDADEFKPERWENKKLDWSFIP
jgi:cytochrome P450